MLGWELPPFHTGGLGVVSEQLSRYLANSGADIDFVLPYTADFSHIEHMDIHSSSNMSYKNFLHTDTSYGSFGNVSSVESSFHGEISPMHKEYLKEVNKLVSSNEYDVIHAHDWLTLQAGVRAKQLAGVPLVAHVHATEYDRSGGACNPMIEEIEYIGLHQADKVIAVSQLTKDTLVREYDLNKSSIEVLHNKHEIKPQDIITPNDDHRYIQWLKDNGHTIVLSLGRVTIQKGLPFLIQAFAKALKIHDKLILVIAGCGPDHDEIVRLTADYNVATNILFTSEHTKGERWRDAFTSSDIFVMPSVSEPFGLTPIEAISFNSATIISNQSGISEVLKNTLKFNYWDTDKLAEDIVALANFDSLREHMVASSKVEISKQSWAESVDQLMQLYETLITRKPINA